MGIEGKILSCDVWILWQSAVLLAAVGVFVLSATLLRGCYMMTFMLHFTHNVFQALGWTCRLTNFTPRKALYLLLTRQISSNNATSSLPTLPCMAFWSASNQVKKKIKIKAGDEALLEFQRRKRTPDRPFGNRELQGRELEGW